jgi:hypothetical protein
MEGEVMETPCLLPSEVRVLGRVRGRLRRVQRILERTDLSGDLVDVRKCFRLLKQVKDTLGNSNNDVSFVATLLAKAYLARRHSGCAFDGAGKSQSAPGLDIDVVVGARRIVGEVKTTYPYNETDFGAAQLDAFRADFRKLAAARADAKYLFLTEPEAFDVLRKRYRRELRGVRVVSLLDGKAFVG